MARSGPGGTSFPCTIAIRTHLPRSMIQRQPSRKRILGPTPAISWSWSTSDSGENGLFAAGEFTALTTLGQMAFVTPEEIARNVVREIEGGNTGTDVVAAIDSSVMGPSYRAAFLRSAALNRLHQLEQEHNVDFSGL